MANEKSLFRLELSGHLVTLDIEHDKLFRRIEQFLAQA